MSFSSALIFCFASTYSCRFRMFTLRFNYQYSYRNMQLEFVVSALCSLHSWAKMENGGLGDTIIGRIGDACLSADCCCSDIANFLFIIFYAICFFFRTFFPYFFLRTFFSPCFFKLLYFYNRSYWRRMSFCGLLFQWYSKFFLFFFYAIGFFPVFVSASAFL